jgi:hypothetical protein
MGAVLEKERVVREEDLSEYLKSQDAQATYLQKPLNDDYALLSYLNNSFVKLPSGDEYLLKSSANNMFQPKDNYVSLKDFNDYKTTSNINYQPKGDYLTQDIGDSRYARLTNGSLSVPGNITSGAIIWNKGNDFMLGTNNDRGNFSNNMWGGRALVKDSNTQLAINYTGDFGGGVRIDGIRGLNLSQGPILANTPGTQSVIQNLYISNGFNAPNAFSSIYGVNLGAGGINSTTANIPFRKSLVNPTAGSPGTITPLMVSNRTGNMFGMIGVNNNSTTNPASVVIGNASTIDGATPTGSLFVTSEGRVGVGTNNPVSTLDVGANGKLCFGTGKCINVPPTISNGTPVTWSTS